MLCYVLTHFALFIGIYSQDCPPHPCVIESTNELSRPIVDCRSNPESTCNYLFHLPNDTWDLTLSFKSLPDYNSTFLKNYSKLETLYYNSVIITNATDLVTLLTTIPDLIKQNLKKLTFSKNDISNWPENLFEGFANVEILLINHNKITSINAEQFLGLQNLKRLDLSSNQINIVQIKTFISMSKLTDLVLRVNNLNNLQPKMFEGLNNVDEIDLSGNQIKNIFPEAFENLASKTTINLEGNKISVLDKTFLNYSGAKSYDEFFTKFKITSNEWICDCHMVNFVVWLKQRFFKQEKLDVSWWTNITNVANINIKMDATDSLRCKSPPNLKSRHLLYLDEQQLLCAYNESTASFINCTKNSTDYHKCLKLDKCKDVSSINENCLVCKEGFYNNSANNQVLQCLRCPPLTSSKVGAQSIEECYCIQGFQQKMFNNTICEACPRNTVKSAIGPEQCFECDWSRSCTTTYAADIECQCQYSLPFYVYVIMILLLLVCLLSSIGGLVLYIRRKRQIKFYTQVLTLLKSIDNSKHINLKISQIEKAEIKCKSIQYGVKLGDGCFGEVYQAFITKLNGKKERTIAAIKQLKKNPNRAEIKALQCELKQLIYVEKHPNIIEFYGFKGFESKLTLIYEYAANGDLLQYVKKFKKITASNQDRNNSSTPTMHSDYVPLSTMTDNVLYFPISNGEIDEKKLITIMYQISKGMEHLANLKCIHRDLAARNILLTGNSNIQAKIADFGLARDACQNGYYKQTIKGFLPIKWMSIEALEYDKFSTKSDVWSFGVVFWEVFTLGKSPFDNIPPSQFLNRLKQGLVLPNTPEWPNYVCNFIRNCMKSKTSDRPDFRQLRSQLEAILQNEYIDMVDACLI